MELVHCLSQASAGDIAHTCAVESVGGGNCTWIKQIERRCKMPAKAVAGYGDGSIDQTSRLQARVPLLHVVDLTERPAVGLDLLLVGLLVVLGCIVGKFRAAEAQNKFAVDEATRWVCLT